MWHSPSALLSLGLAISSSVAGKLQERFGVACNHGIRDLAGFGILSLTAYSNNLMMLWLSAGVLVGLADGAGYSLTLFNCEVVPERKGLISAFAIGSYGPGSLGFKFIDAHLLASGWALRNLWRSGAPLCLVMILGATLMKRCAAAGSEKPLTAWWRTISPSLSPCVSRSTGCWR